MYDLSGELQRHHDMIRQKLNAAREREELKREIKAELKQEIMEEL